MTSINLLYIDDDQPAQIKSLIDTLKANSDYDLQITHQLPTKMTIISSTLRNDYDGILIDQKLDNHTGEGEPVDYFGAALAQNLRTLMAGQSDNVSYKPIFLFSLETLLIEYYNPDSTSHDLFDLVISKGVLSNNETLKKKVSLIGSIVNAYKIVQNEKDLCIVLNIKNKSSLLDKRFENYVQYFTHDIHKVVNSIHSTLLRSSGMLVSENTLATRLGIDLAKSEEWVKVKENLVNCKYNGVFSDYYDRWWWFEIEIWINEVLGCQIFKGLDSVERVTLLKDKLNLSKIKPIVPRFKNQSTKFWVNCVVSDEPLDTIDALRASSMELKPWEEDKYLSVSVVLERRASNYKIHPEDRMKFERIRKRFGLL